MPFGFINVEVTFIMARTGQEGVETLIPILLTSFKPRLAVHLIGGTRVKVVATADYFKAPVAQITEPISSETYWIPFKNLRY
jgi:hypothetical protein